MMRVAVTGGRGFIGSTLIEALIRRGDQMRMLSRREDLESRIGVDCFVGDLTNADTDLPAFLDNVEILYHCAGEINNSVLMHELHVQGTARLIRAAQGRIRRWVQLSSVGAYGPVRSGTVTENSQEAPDGDYEITKTEADRLVCAAAADGGFEMVILRPSIVYGPAMTNQSLYQMIGAIARGWFAFIGQPGASANYVHVDNVVQALLLCGEHPNAAGRRYNVSDYATIEDMVSWIAGALGRPVPKMRLPLVAARWIADFGRFVPGIPLTEGRVNALTNFARYADERIRRDLGYRPEIGLQQGFEQMALVWRQRFGDG